MTAMLAMMQHRRKKVLKSFPFIFPVFILRVFMFAINKLKRVWHLPPTILGSNHCAQ